jgi:hypothetical protein
MTSTSFLYLAFALGPRSQDSEGSEFRSLVFGDDETLHLQLSLEYFFIEFSSSLCRFSYARMLLLQTIFTVPSLRYQSWAVEGAWRQGREDRIAELALSIATRLSCTRQ